ncbi:MAG: serine hydrolase domain-containing protein [Verrucomicrobiota bacterium]
MSFASVRAGFERNFRERGELGASVSVWKNGVEVLSLAAGWCEKEHLRPWTKDTLVPVYSATKVPAAATLLWALELRGLNVDTPVREVWRGFPIAEAKFRYVLSHQCGLAALDRKADVFDHDQVVTALEAQKPAWLPGEGHGYHPRTFGALVDEPVRILTGRTLGNVWRDEFAAPAGLDFWIGLPECEWPRVARLYPGKASRGGLEDAFYKEMSIPGSFVKRAFASPVGLHAVHEMNEPRAWSAGLPAMGGVGTASALAKFYQILLGRIPGPLSDDARIALMTPQSDFYDRVLLRRTVFTCGAQVDPLSETGEKERRVYGPGKSAFGHPGAGGSHAFADPATGISFSYVMNAMELSVMPTARCLDLVAAAFE